MSSTTIRWEIFTVRVKLWPWNRGETLVQRVTLMACQFRYRGIAEFKAVFRMPSQATPGTRGAWCGTALSNSVGVMVNVTDEEDDWSWSKDADQGRRGTTLSGSSCGEFGRSLAWI